MHLGHLHELAWSHGRNDILYVESLWDALVPLIQHGLKTLYPSLAFLGRDSAGAVGVQQIVYFTLNVGEFNTSSVVVEVYLAILRPYQSSTVSWCHRRQSDIDIVIILTRRCVSSQRNILHPLVDFATAHRETYLIKNISNPEHPRPMFRLCSRKAHHSLLRMQS